MRVLLLVVCSALLSVHSFEKITLKEEWLKTPQTYPAPDDLQKPDVKAVFYDGAPYKEKPTRVFAYYGIPKTEPGQKVPAIVLVHGGGGTAFETWVRQWNKRGYAAIAMDTCAGVPKGTKPNSPFSNNWARHEFSGPKGQGDFDNALINPEDQWAYHAVSSIVIGHSLLRSFPEVDAERIGITGVSWGGYLTSMVSGIDTRFKFAAPVYGCGFLGDNSTWLGEFQKIGPEKAAKWLKFWDPSTYLSATPMPTLWVNGTNDFAYPMDSYQKSYRLVKGPRTLCIKVRMPHGHGGAGENPEEILAFAEQICRGGKPLASITSFGAEGPIAWATYASEIPITKGEFNFTRDSGKWKDRKWETLPAKLDAANKKLSAEIPADAKVYYFNAIDERGLYVSSEHVEKN